MIADLKSYPAMKDCGVPWLDMVPETWDVQSLKRVMYSVSEQEQASPSPQHYIALEHVQGWTGRVATGDTAPEGSQLKRFRKGDVLFGKLRPYLAKVAQPAFDGHCVGEFLVLRARGGAIDGRYAEQMLRAAPFIDLVNSTTDGARMPRAEWDDVGNLSVPVPPRPEQAAIVRFLDYADGRIRRYIRAKQQLIKLLEEQKRAIIYRAVTRGLDPNVRLKPSGVEWLGDVPEHWEVRRVKSLSLVKRGASPRPIADPRYFDDAGVYAWVRIADVTASSRYLERTTQRLSSLGQSLSVPLEPGALFLSIAGSVGKPMITRIKCCIHDGFVYFPQFHGNVEYLCRVFSSGTPFARLGKLGTQLNLNTETVGSIFLGWPPADEQAAIVSFLDEATATRDLAIRSAQREISLLHEYRSRLIADVVTGKLDVREAVAGLPDELQQIDEADLEEVVDDELADDLDTELEEVEA